MRILGSIFGPAFDHGVDPALVISPYEDRVVAVNAACADLLGASAEAIAALSVSALHLGQRPALLSFSEAVLIKGSHHTRALTPRHFGGKQMAVEYAGARLPPPAGAPADQALILITLSDLQARRRRELNAESHVPNGLEDQHRIERLFQNLERQNRLILRAAGEGIFGVNEEGVTTFVNPAGAAMLGWRADELTGRNMHATVHHHRPDGSVYPGEACPIYEAFRDGAVHHVDDEVFWRRDGSSFWVDYTSTPIMDQGRPVGAVIIFRDVTLRRETDRALKAALTEVGTLRAQLEQENAYLRHELALEGGSPGVIAQSAAMKRVSALVSQVAPTETPVLLTGEFGVGKEFIARAIHDASPRRGRAFIRIECGGAPDAVAAELFGQSRAASPSGKERAGRFELARESTLFLNDVCELGLEMQARLAEALQFRRYTRLGDERPRKLDVRVIAASRRDLTREVEAGRFRRDLYFLLDVFPIALAPLRERTADIPVLASNFLRSALQKQRRPELWLTEADAARLCAYAWPGNASELQNAIERAVILSRDGRLRFDLPNAPPLLRGGAGETDLETEADRRARERRNLEAVLAATGWKISGAGGAAARLGLRPSTLHSRLKALQIRRPPIPGPSNG